MRFCWKSSIFSDCTFHLCNIHCRSWPQCFECHFHAKWRFCGQCLQRQNNQNMGNFHWVSSFSPPHLTLSLPTVYSLHFSTWLISLFLLFLLFVWTLIIATTSNLLLLLSRESWQKSEESALLLVLTWSSVPCNLIQNWKRQIPFSRLFVWR